MEFWLKNEKENINILLPVTPKEYDIANEMIFETIEMARIGDVNLPTHKRLKIVTIEGFFSVNENYSFLNRNTIGASNAMDYVNYLNKWLDNKVLIRLIITDEITSKCNMICKIESLKYSQNDGTDDINYMLVIREYKSLNAVTKVVNNTTVNNTPTVRPVENAPKTNNRTYTVQSGDCLWNIALKFYGNGNKYTVIYDANRDKIKNPSIIYVGQVLTIP